jgi:hypothetical protein
MSFARLVEPSFSACQQQNCHKSSATFLSFIFTFTLCACVHPAKLASWISYLGFLLHVSSLDAEE